MSNIEIDIHSVKRWLNDGADDQGQPIALVDCRERNEHDVAKIEGAILLPMSSWPPPMESLEALNGKRVVVHCHHGGRSLRVAHWFRQNGHPEATSMSGGIDRWSDEIDPGIAKY
jgi:rhodanese-related sulfurtransferase